MDMQVSLSLEQTQKISQSQIQSLQLLAMDNFELKQMMEQEYLENPLLEHTEELRSGEIDKISREDPERPQRELAAHGDSYIIEDAIISQLRPARYTGTEWKLIHFLISGLDKNGYFPHEPEDIASLKGLPLETVEKCLEDLKQLEPYGIFAKNLQESLLLQLEAANNDNELSRIIITDYMEDLAAGQLSNISRSLKVSTTAVRKCLSEIAKLNPRPLSGFDMDTTSYIVPDIILDLNEEQHCFEAGLNDEWTADYKISDYYYKMMQQSDDEKLQAYFEQRYKRARFLIKSIEQRRETILAIARHAAGIQYDFFRGTGRKQPETMTEVAEALGIAVSTVSRAVRGKYIQYPAGSIFFKELFTASVIQTEGEQKKSGEDIKAQIKVLIGHENKQKPLSDAALVRELEKQDIVISRRTVAKYRESMGIKGCFDRKEF